MLGLTTAPNLYLCLVVSSILEPTSAASPSPPAETKPSSIVSSRLDDSSFLLDNALEMTLHASSS